MELAKPPEDQDLKNIIDKLANFVARNGPEFEQMTKQKQKGNPKFAFLFGGEHFNYYCHKVATEQAIIKKHLEQLQQQQQQPPTQAPPPQMAPLVPPQMSAPPVSAAPWQPPPAQAAAPNVPPPAGQPNPQLIDTIGREKNAALEQIKQSETNLAAQYQSLIQQQQVQIEEAIIQAKEEQVLELCNKCDVKIEDMDSLVKPIIESCTKDAISSGKNWIFMHCVSKDHGELVSKYMLKRISSKEGTFEMRLHLVYLINDILHHCQRKNAEDLKDSMESVVIPIFCCAHACTADEEKRSKLTKLLNLWVKNSYFSPETLEQLKDPNAAMATYQANLITENGEIVQRISADVNTRYASLQKQHQDFVNHLNTQIQNLEAQLAAHHAQLSQPGVSSGEVSATTPGQPAAAPGQPPTFPPGFPPPNFSQPPPGFGPPPTAATQSFDYAHGANAPGAPAPIVQDYNHGQGGPPPDLQLPDFSRPPPGFMNMPDTNVPPPNVNEADLMPTVPYFELPAGLMAPLVKLDDCSYKSLNPRDIRLPPPQAPTPRLLAAVEAFYSAPAHDRPRDSDGWEKLGLFEFFKAKQRAKKAREERKSRSPSNSSSSGSSSRSGSSSSRSDSRSSSRSRSSSPNRGKRSKSRSTSPPYQRRSRSVSPARRRRSRSRSVTPPSFADALPQTSMDLQLGQDNKGHQLLKKMGWGGKGLGAEEQGIVDPVKHAEIRDRSDMFKGIGINMADPFEQFRKSKSHGFIQRMRARDPA